MTQSQGAAVVAPATLPASGYIGVTLLQDGRGSRWVIEAWVGGRSIYVGGMPELDPAGHSNAAKCAKAHDQFLLSRLYGSPRLTAAQWAARLNSPAASYVEEDDPAVADAAMSIRDSREPADPATLGPRPSVIAHCTILRAKLAIHDIVYGLPDHEPNEVRKWVERYGEDPDPNMVATAAAALALRIGLQPAATPTVLYATG